MNVVAAWERGYTGKGVVVTILDDGIERTHTDLIGNYVSRDTVLVVEMLVNSLCAVTASWLNSSQRSRVGARMNMSARGCSVKH